MLKSEADTRKKYIEEVLYHFRLGVREGDSYTGYASVKFFLKAVPENEGDLFLNFQAKAVSQYTVNGVLC